MATSYPAHCCRRLRDQVDFRCPDHPHPRSCGDYLIGYDAVFDEYGIWVHDVMDADATRVTLTIEFCPFCGTALPPSRRTEWFDRVEALGIEPWTDDVPAELERYGWWRDVGAG